MSIYATYLAFSIQVIERKSNKQNVPHTFDFSCSVYDGKKEIFIETLPFRHRDADLVSDFNCKNIGTRSKEKLIIYEGYYKAKGLNNFGDIFFAINSWVADYIRGTNYVRTDEVTVTANLYGITSKKTEKIQVTAKREDQQFALYPILSSNKSNPAIYLEKNPVKETRNNLELKVTEDFFHGKNLIGVTDMDRAMQAIKEWMHFYMNTMHESKMNLPEKVCII